MRLPSPSLVLSTLALAVAATGTAQAAGVVNLTPGSVTTREVRNASIGVQDLSPRARRALVNPTRAKLAAAITDVVTDPASGLNITVRAQDGPQGPAGSPGVLGTEVVALDGRPIDPQSRGSATVTCGPGQKVLSGGGTFGGPLGGGILESSTPAGEGWTVTYTNASNTTRTPVAFAICARLAG